MTATGTWKVGDAVWVHAFGHWYGGVVFKIGKPRKKLALDPATGATVLETKPGRVHVEYVTGSGAHHQKALAADSPLLERRVSGDVPPSHHPYRRNG